MEAVLLSKDSVPAFVYENNVKPGIARVADRVREDVKKVLGVLPAKEESAGQGASALVFGIAGQSGALEELNTQGKIDLSAVAGKREVYGFFVLPSEQRIVIAGSDKRGTIYGLFHLSELLGVSPLSDWSAVPPAKREELTLTEADSFVSKEPSVEYRGFFINDEWPCFGNWCSKRFGGFTAQMYEEVFFLLLRMKGNYLWPAMWSSCFAEDGPGLASAELADELGVVMGLSHHEPCLRHGEEYSHVRGADSIYGDAWNFRSNKEGITRFWRDGLKRNGHLENVITVGMRGERDSTILGKNATLKDNIDLLRDVLRTQEQLIREEVNEDLSKVPRMLALYKEVEAYYYGDADTPGLREGCRELEDVILMLCDDNHGYVRSLPDEKMLSHPGGFGMYYHFDYHGGPVSYEWTDSTHLPEVWEQMTTAYEHGIRRLWIVNVGDLGLQEMPLSYFLDLAYDYDRWGIEAPNSTKDYLAQWMERQFGPAFEAADLDSLTDLFYRYGRLMHNRRPEHLNDTVYSLHADYEAERVLAEADALEEMCLGLREKCPAEYRDAFCELIAYNVLSGTNLIRLWITRARNHYFASLGLIEANRYAKRIPELLERDRKLSEELHTAAGGKWYGFGMAEHIGFRNWNSEERVNPVAETVFPIERAEAVVGLFGQREECCGGEWGKHDLTIRVYRRLEEAEAEAGFFIGLKGGTELSYRISTASDWIRTDRTEGVLTPEDALHEIRLVADKKAARAAGETEGRLEVSYGSNRVFITVKDLEEGDNGRLVIDAARYTTMNTTDGGYFAVIRDLGRREDGLKRFPPVGDLSVDEAPSVDYNIRLEADGDYLLRFQLMPCNPYRRGKRICLHFDWNREGVKALPVISESFDAGSGMEWGKGVLDHVRYAEVEVKGVAGENSLRWYGTEAENIPERIWLVRKGSGLQQSYLGPDESVTVHS
ncbi:MAG: glycosyl hydrolase 115 family protein [Lachnospiraceae bacterium]|nr:glycosyl hydrolase 115 family protein [Lachnospiraceae bacterium]